MSMSIQSVIGSLEHDARMAIAAAETTPDYASVVVSIEKARRWRDMAAAVRLAIQTQPVAKVTRRRSATLVADRPGKAPAKVASMGALAFWGFHGQAVTAISARYGSQWRVAAPFGETESVTITTKLASCVTERGTKLKWGKDHRFPAAHYWPGGKFPDGVTIGADYPRAVGKYVATKDEHGHYSVLAFDPPEAPRDAAWHIANGYVWIAQDSVDRIGGTRVAKAGWVFEIEARAEAARVEAIEEAREYRRRAKMEAAALSYGPQPFADIEDDFVYADAAD